MSKASKRKRDKGTGKRNRNSGKAATILGLLNHKGGVSIDDLAKATGWKPHSVRGFLSTHVRKKLGLKLRFSKEEGSPRVYKIKSCVTQSSY